MTGTDHARRPVTGGGGAGRGLSAVTGAVYLLGLLVLVVVVNDLGQRPALRWQADATKTRAYSLSAQTQGMLTGLEGKWTIALVQVEAGLDRAVRRQIDEVLDRFARTAPALTVLRIDPTSPRTLRDYQRLLANLTAIYGDRVQAYDEALDDGLAAFNELQVLAQQQAQTLQELAEHMPVSLPGREPFRQRVGLMGLLADQGEAVAREVRSARRTDDSRPIPDYEAARSILAAALSQWSGELADLARGLDRWLDETDTRLELRQAAAASGRACEQLARRLAAVADPLERLEPLELSEIGRQLQHGEAVIVVGPRRAAVIPSQQLFPRTNLRAAGGVAVSFDQRFRGEQLVASTIRSLLRDDLPVVVFMHAQPDSLLAPHERDADLVGVASMLRVSRYEVREWQIGQAERPVTPPGRPVVWVVVPPPQRASLELDPAERQLVDSVQQLIAEGQPVLLSLYPSLLPRYGRPDPWAELARPFGLQVDTARVVYESVRVSEDERRVERGQTSQQYPAGHPISEAVQGQRSYFGLPVQVKLAEAPPGVERWVVAGVPAGPDRWLESQWERSVDHVDPAATPDGLKEAVPLLVAAERAHPVERRRQRFMLAGSGGWMLSFVADVAVNVGGDRFALVNPGNVELMLASVAWLAGLDDLIAPSPAGQEVARLQSVTPGARRWWGWLIIAVLPGLCLGLGAGVWLRRRR